MRGERLRHTLRLFCIPSAVKRADYLRKHHVFAHIGENSYFMPRKVPLYANLISLGDNVGISSNVSLDTHDGIHRTLNWYSKSLPQERQHEFREAIGCIEIGNNVFVAAGCHIFYDVKIGDNVIITAGSVVTNDIPPNSVVRGVPAKVICPFDGYYNMRAFKESYPKEMLPGGEKVPDELAEWMWNEFHKRRLGE